LLEGKSPTDAELREIRSYADGIGPNSRLVIPASEQRKSRPTSSRVRSRA
jgi:hypothetical protein